MKESVKTKVFELVATGALVKGDLEILKLLENGVYTKNAIRQAFPRLSGSSVNRALNAFVEHKLVDLKPEGFTIVKE